MKPQGKLLSAAFCMAQWNAYVSKVDYRLSLKDYKQYKAFGDAEDIYIWGLFDSRHLNMPIFFKIARFK